MRDCIGGEVYLVGGKQGCFQLEQHKFRLQADIQRWSGPGRLGKRDLLRLEPSEKGLDSSSRTTVLQ